MNKLWGGRFSKETDQKTEAFTASISFDKALYQEDIEGSVAHATMLGKCGILTSEETKIITDGLFDILKEIKEGKCSFTLTDEDIHMNIEKLLTLRIGSLAGKLHTGRSRNDQIALDMHLYVRSQIVAVSHKLLLVQQTLIDKAKKHLDLIMPGYTHLQRAQPILFSHHLLAYVAMFERDLSRFKDSFPRANQSPLGAAALAGTKIPIDRTFTADLLHFDSIYENSLDAVSDRDFVVEFLANSALLMIHLSRLSEELILWSSQEFGFITFDDAYCTGSSLMPQKKNPDIPELIRGKTGRVIGSLMTLLTLLKGLPLAYNRDLQEDKEPLFDTVKTLDAVLTILPPLLSTMQPNQDKMRAAAQKGFLNATDLADDLVMKGVPFREAHAHIGKQIQSGLEETYDLETVVNNKTSEGGTATDQVLLQLKRAEERLHLNQETLNKKQC